MFMFSGRSEEKQRQNEQMNRSSCLDWVYCLTRPARQCGHRGDEVLAEVRSFARKYAGNLLAHVASQPVPFEDLHALNGTMSAFAELQQTVPGLLRTERPLKLILDRRPFI